MKEVYKRLVRTGYLYAAHDLLKFMRSDSIHIADSNDEAWISGLANYLMENFNYTNTRIGMRFRK